MKSDQTYNGYSAEVRMHLESEGKVYHVSELGPDSRMLRSGEAIPADGQARLVVEVDGDRSVHDVTVACTNPSLPELSIV